MRTVTLLAVAVLLLTPGVRAVGGDGEISREMSSGAVVVSPAQLISPSDFANDLGINPRPRVYPQPQTPDPQTPAQARAQATAPTTTSTTTSWTSTTREPLVIRWGGGPASQAVAKWISTKHTWTIGHARAWPASVQPAPMARPKPRPVTTTTAVTTTTTTMASTAAAPVTPNFEEAPPPPAIPTASAQGRRVVVALLREQVRDDQLSSGTINCSPALISPALAWVVGESGDGDGISRHPPPGTPDTLRHGRTP